MRFSFKKHIREGRYGSFQKKSSDIKLKRKIVGILTEVEFDKWKVSFAVKKEKTEEDPTPFKWIRLTKTCSSEIEAREFVNKNADVIVEKYDLYPFED